MCKSMFRQEVTGRVELCFSRACCFCLSPKYTTRNYGVPKWIFNDQMPPSNYFKLFTSSHNKAHSGYSYVSPPPAQRGSQWRGSQLATMNDDVPETKWRTRNRVASHFIGERSQPLALTLASARVKTKTKTKQKGQGEESRFGLVFSYSCKYMPTTIWTCDYSQQTFLYLISHNYD